MVPAGIIYRITNTQNGKVYIGQTTHTLRDRWRLHCARNSTCSLLKQAIQEYGKDAFIMEQVDTAESRDELNQKEMAWIERENSIHPNGYNVDKGGYHIQYTQAARQRMSNNQAHHREDSKRLISSRLSGKYAGKASFNHRAVVNLDTGERFDTATEAAKAYGVTVSTLTKTCRGVQRRTAGHRWAFLEGGDAI